jgi:hypothetical protein
MGAPALLTVIGMALPLAMSAQGTCSEATLKGEYGARLKGTKPTPPGSSAPTERFVGIALRNFDGKGNFVEEAASQHGAITGAVPRLDFGAIASGTYEVYPNCTGKSTLSIPALNLTIKSEFVIVNNGQAINEIVTDPAPNIVIAVYTKK